MKLSENAMCAALLCSYLGIKSGDNDLKPFSLGEWNRFLDKVIENKLEPKVIFDRETDWGSRLSYSPEQVKRIETLSARGMGMAFELDDLNRKGIKIVTLFDADYPPLLKRRLKRKAPPVLFYAGDITLASKIGIAVVGSRNVDEDGIEFTRRLAEKAAEEKLVIYSGGAQGVDTISETTAIDNGGAAVAYVADSLLSRIKKKNNINNILNQRLLLISDVKPDAGFSTARAMNRNKFIYASAYGTFVASSDYNSGGTWAGAVEALNNDLGRVLVWDHSVYDGNRKLIERGGIPYKLSDEKLYDVVTKKETYEQMRLFNMLQVSTEDISQSKNDVEEVTEENFDLYNHVKDYIVNHLIQGSSADQLAERFCIAKGQMKVWLKRLCNEGLAEYENGVYSKAK